LHRPQAIGLPGNDGDVLAKHFAQETGGITDHLAEVQSPAIFL